MAMIRPFRALHFDARRVSIEQVIAPPYDIISVEEEKIYQERDPHNIIRLILGQSKPDRPRPDQAYRDARSFLNEWTKSGILARPSQDAFYLHEETYQHPYQDQALTRIALFAALKLEPFENKVVFRHEHTYLTAKEDRAKLLRAAECNFSPVFILYEDSTGSLRKIYQTLSRRQPLFDLRDDQAMRHRLWVVDGGEEIEVLRQAFDRRCLFIADGHHRYETALSYAQEKNSGGPISGTHPWDYVLSAFVQFDDPGLLILPIHRLVSKSVAINKKSFLEGLKGYFVPHSVSKTVLEKVSQGSIHEGLGLALSETECYLLELKDKTWARQMMASGKPPAWYDLDVNLLSFLILEPLLGISKAGLERSVSYVPALGEAFQKLKAREAVCAFILRPISAQTIKEICESGELMPQKSTYFYPKFPSGLLIYRHGDGPDGARPEVPT